MGKGEGGNDCFVLEPRDFDFFITGLENAVAITFYYPRPHRAASHTVKSQAIILEPTSTLSLLAGHEQA